jgi:AAA domain
MSSTRRSTDGTFHQERFCSSEEFQGDAINGVAAAKRISIVKDRAVGEVLWFVQWRSLVPGGLQQLCDDLAASFPERIGTPLLRKLIASKRRVLRNEEIGALREECRIFDAFDCFGGTTTDDQGRLVDDGGYIVPVLSAAEQKVDYYSSLVADRLQELPEVLTRFCLDPKTDLAKGIWFFSDLVGALVALREKFISSARSRLADTVVTRRINETLDFWFARRRMVLIEGVAGIGRTETARAWCDARAGLVRYVEVASSSDDRSFFSSMARQLGVARGASFKSQQIKVRVEEMLATSGLGLMFDESQYLFGQYVRPRRTPDRLLWVKTVFDAGTPIALVAHTDFSKLQAHFVAKTLWSDEQFERRVNRRITLPTEHSKQDMIKIARAHHPGGEMRTWKLLAAYALGTEKKQASGVTEALESAQYRAEQLGRDQVTFADVEAALIHDHCYLKPAPQAALDAKDKEDWQSVRATTAQVATTVQGHRKTRTDSSDSDFHSKQGKTGGSDWRISRREQYPQHREDDGRSPRYNHALGCSCRPSVREDSGRENAGLELLANRSR